MLLTLYSLVAILSILGIFVYCQYRKLQMTFTIVIACFVVFVISLFSPRVYGLSVITIELGFVPQYLLEPGANLITLITSMFVHADIMHILFNMLVLLLIGVPFEQRVGRANFAIIYFVSGIAGALLFSVLNLNTFTFLIGASGAIFGVLGAFAALYPRDEITMLLGFFIVPRVPVIFVAIGLGLLETLYVFSGASIGVANEAHIGGLVAGVFIAPLLIREKTMARKRNLNYAGLAQLATSQRQREMLDRIFSETEDDVRAVWLQHFLETVSCPHCGGHPKIKNNKIVCCDYEIPLYEKKAK